MGAQTGATTDPAERQRMRRRQEDVLNQTGRASMFPGIEPGPSGARQEARSLTGRKGIDFGPGRSRRY